MQTIKSLTALLIAGLVAIPQSASAQEPTLPSGPLLGETPPGLTPKLFAPGLVSTEDAFELNSVFTKDGKHFMFSRRIDGQFKVFEMFQRDSGQWTEPRLASFSRTFPGHADVDMMWAPGEKRLYFISTRPLPGYPLDRYNIWYTDRVAGSWIDPVPLGPDINRLTQEFYPMIVGDGSLYFTAPRADSLGATDSYRAQFVGGAFDTPVNLGPSINSTAREGDIFVAADESYIIHVSTGRDDSLGSGDLYISFKQSDGSWSDDVHMGPEINSDVIDFCPMVTPDGKYFFFSRGGDIYWVDAAVLEQFRP